MNAWLAYLNGAGAADSTAMRRLAIVTGVTAESRRPAVDDSKPADERQAEEEERVRPISKPGGFENDPPDPKNPNEVRERHLKKIKPI